MSTQEFRKAPLHDPKAVQWRRDELTYVGFVEMNTAESVKYHISQKDDQVKLVFINSVCGCAAGSAKPGVSLVLQNNIIQDKLLTSFAGMDRDAVDYLREVYLKDYLLPWLHYSKIKRLYTLCIGIKLR